MGGNYGSSSLYRTWLVPTILTIVVFVLDCLVPLGVAMGILYIPIFIFITRIPGRRVTIFSAIVFTVLIVAAALLHSSSLEYLPGVINRALSILLVWIIAIITNTYKSTESWLQKTLKAEKQKYAQITSDIKDYAFFLLTKEGFVENWNSGIRRLTGMSKGELIGKHFSAFFGPIEKDKNIPEIILKEALKKGTTKYEGEISSKSEQVLWADVTVTSIRDKSNNLTGYSVVIHDRNAQKEFEESLIKTNREVLRKNEELKQFAYISAHDLQEPLRTISSYVSFIKNNYELNELDERGKKGFNFILEASKRMSNLLKGLLDYLNIGEETIKEKVDLNEIVVKMRNDLSGWLEDLQIQIEINHLPIVIGLKNELKSLVYHLVDNSIKFRKQDVPCNIVIDSEIKDNMWLISVKDNGIGVEQAHQDKAFKIFQQLHNKNVYEGSGIGLAHCKKIVELHGGKIWMQSAINKGTTVLFTLPLS